MAAVRAIIRVRDPFTGTSSGAAFVAAIEGVIGEILAAVIAFIHIPGCGFGL